MKRASTISILLAINAVAAFLLLHSITTYVPSVGVSNAEQAMALYLSLALNMAVIFIIFKIKRLTKSVRILTAIPSLLLLAVGFLILQHSLLESILTYFGR